MPVLAGGSLIGPGELLLREICSLSQEVDHGVNIVLSWVLLSAEQPSEFGLSHEQVVASVNKGIVLVICSYDSVVSSR